MKRADHCAVCGIKLDELSLQLQHQNDRRMFCSLECLVSYAVDQIRERLEQRNLQVRLFAREQKKLYTGRHSKRGRSTVA